MNGQSAQYMFSTASVMVFSAAKEGVEEAKRLVAMAAEVSSLPMTFLLSSVEEQGCEEIESDRSNNQKACENEPGLNKPIWQRTLASIAISAGELGGSIYKPVPVAEEARSHRKEVGLVRCEPGKIANPDPTHTEAE